MQRLALIALCTAMSLVANPAGASPTPFDPNVRTSREPRLGYGCGSYGTFNCQLEPHLSSDDHPGAIYDDGPRCFWRDTPSGRRRLCRAF